MQGLSLPVRTLVVCLAVACVLGAGSGAAAGQAAALILGFAPSPAAVLGSARESPAPRVLALPPGATYALLPAEGPSIRMISSSPAQGHDRSRVPGVLATLGLLLIPADQRIAERLRQPGEGGEADSLTEAINRLGDADLLIPVLVSVCALGGHQQRRTATLSLAALLNAGVITQTTKSLVGRVRPDTRGLDPGRFTGPSMDNNRASFPSGHAANAFAVARVVAARHPEEKWLCYGLATFVAACRVRKHAHYLSDVFVGAAVGIYSADAVLGHASGFPALRF